MTSNIIKIALVGALLGSTLSVAVFANTSAALAGDMNFETIYNPNVPSLLETDEMSQRILDYARRKQLHFEEPGSQFDNGSLDDGQADSY